MSKYEFVISAQDKTAQAFTAINSKLGTVTKHAAGTAAAVAGVTAAFGAFVVSSANNAKELEAQARLAGLNVEEFQSLSYAFSMFNIEQEKFADISKDVQDKLGDFIATGAGPFKDFFEQVAPQVGLTADALKDLSSTDVLIAVKKAMDDANVSAKEQVFYMEAIANDATLLLPALQNNGAAIKEYSAQFNNLNLAMSQAEVEKMAELANEFKRIEATASSIGNKLASNFAEPLADLLEVLEGGLNEHLLRGEKAFKGMAAGIFELAAASATISQYNPFAIFASGLSQDEFAQQAADFKGTANSLYADINQIVDQLSELDNPDFGSTNNIFEGMGDMFNLEGAVTNIDTSPIKEVTKEVEAATKEVENSFLNSLSLIDEINANAFTFDETMAENAGMFWDNFEERGFTAYQNLQEGNQSFWEQWLEASKNTLTNFDDLSAMTIESFSNKMGSALESVIFDSESLGDAFKGVMQGMARSVVNALGQMAAQWLAYKLVQLAIGKSTAVAGAAGLALNAQAQSLMAGLNAFASTAAIPVVGPPAAPAAMGAALAVTQPIAASISALTASAAIASYDGGGFTGSGARIGGMDGKGGKLAMLHPREKVIDLTRDQGAAAPQISYVVNGANLTDEQIVKAIERSPKKIARALRRIQSRPM
ncbi:hypothetical protein [Alteromonas macleodii]|uniref:hypothetical protein n=1 Tax=Alteromonas macleodii TaxID=28108 RepID=UPI001925FB44|nr:hypothetical protein [Alteromonas macleodii]MBL3809560.1 hypothetical protein [Alteromonas macleodii]MBL3883097.1 hypothetical protein [Alteromonas macleodii]